MWADSFEVYLKPGDYVQAGYCVTNGMVPGAYLTGDTLGTTTYFSISWMNP